MAGKARRIGGWGFLSRLLLGSGCERRVGGSGQAWATGRARTFRCWPSRRFDGVRSGHVVSAARRHSQDAAQPRNHRGLPQAPFFSVTTNRWYWPSAAPQATAASAGDTTALAASSRSSRSRSTASGARPKRSADSIDPMPATCRAGRVLRPGRAMADLVARTSRPAPKARACHHDQAHRLSNLRLGSGPR